MEIQQLPDGTFLLVAVPDEKTEHMARMVSRTHLDFLITQAFRLGARGTGRRDLIT